MQLDEVAKVIRGIVERTLKVKTLIDQAARTSDDQVRRLQQISGAMGQMEKVTSENAAGAEERSAASLELSDQSDKLREVVAALQAIV
jgi:methyl-accepting chemotaxis protein